MRRRWSVGLTLLALILSTLIGIVLIETVDGGGIARLEREIQTVAPVLSLIRLSIIVSIYVAWPGWLQFCRRREWISHVSEQMLLARRHRWAIGLVAIELLLGLDVLNRFHTLTDHYGP